MADGPQEDGVVPAQLRYGRIGQRLARPQIAVAAKIVVRQRIGEAGARRRHFQDFQPFGHYLGAGPIAGHHRDVVVHFGSFRFGFGRGVNAPRLVV